MSEKFNQPNPQECEKFQEQLPELLGAGAPIEDNPHLKTCELCRALLRDLQAIADAARQLMEVDQPKDDLWERIESAIQAEKADGGPAGE
ncbi:MAG TPA: hypothetical protein VF392_08090 [Terracidiphilus sp.]